jgi:hypothetical protein
MRIGGRRLGTIAGALFQRRHYLALYRAFRVYADPLDALARYLLKRGGYPHRLTVRTPTGPYALTLYSHDDILTVNEIFCRQDYPAGPEDRIVVDFGSNIGISAAYFLTRSTEGHAHLFAGRPLHPAPGRGRARRRRSRFRLGGDRPIRRRRAGDRPNPPGAVHGCQYGPVGRDRRPRPDRHPEDRH